MKIGIQTIGTKGDVGPYLALADGLIAKGHEVRLVVASTDNKKYVSDQHALIIEHIGKDYYQSDWIENFKGIWSKKDAEQGTISLAKQFEPVVDELIVSARQLCQECDVVMGNQLQYPLACVAEGNSTPFIVFSMMPNVFPSQFLPPHGLPNAGKYINPLWWKLISVAIDKVFKQRVNRFRMAESMQEIKDVLNEVWVSKYLNLVSVSSVFCTQAPDWNNIYICGNIDKNDIEEYGQVPQGLEKFLAEGPPPVYFTIGSCVNYLEDSLETIVRIFYDAVQLSGCRAIIQSDWASVGKSIPDDSKIYRIGAISHREIFPRCAAVVHHGSHGSSHMATYCGCPSIVVAYAFDQPFWAKELRKAGVGAKPLHRRNVTATSLAEQINDVLGSPKIKKRAETCSSIMKNENGVDMAVQLVEDVFRKISENKIKMYA